MAIFLGPTLLLYFAFTIYPVFVTFYNSVHSLRMDLGMLYEFVGLDHFREILTSDEDQHAHRARPRLRRDRAAPHVYLLRAFFAQIPTELEEAARIDGCGDWSLFWRVMLPMALPAVATTVILNLIYFWNEYLYAVVFITRQQSRTLPLAIQFLVSDQDFDIGMLATGLMIATLPVLVLYLFLSEWFVKGMTAGAIKG